MAEPASISSEIFFIHSSLLFRCFPVGLRPSCPKWYPHSFCIFLLPSFVLLASSLPVSSKLPVPKSLSQALLLMKPNKGNGSSFKKPVTSFKKQVTTPRSKRTGVWKFSYSKYTLGHTGNIMVKLSSQNQTGYCRSLSLISVFV